MTKVKKGKVKAKKAETTVKILSLHDPILVHLMPLDVEVSCDGKREKTCIALVKRYTCNNRAYSLHVVAPCSGEVKHAIENNMAAILKGVLDCESRR